MAAACLEMDMCGAEMSKERGCGCFGDLFQIKEAPTRLPHDDSVLCTSTPTLCFSGASVPYCFFKSENSELNILKGKLKVIMYENNSIANIIKINCQMSCQSFLVLNTKKASHKKCSSHLCLIGVLTVNVLTG